MVPVVADEQAPRRQIKRYAVATMVAVAWFVGLGPAATLVALPAGILATVTVTAVLYVRKFRIQTAFRTILASDGYLGGWRLAIRTEVALS